MADLAVGHEIIGADQIAVVDVGFGHELVDLDGAGRFQRDVVQLILRHLDVGIGVDLVALHDVVGGDFLAGVRIDLGIFDAVAGLAVDLVEADLLGIRRRRIEGNRDRSRVKGAGSLSSWRGGPWDTPKTQQTTWDDTTGEPVIQADAAGNLRTALTVGRPAARLGAAPAAYRRPDIAGRTPGTSFQDHALLSIPRRRQGVYAQRNRGPHGITSRPPDRRNPDRSPSGRTGAFGACSALGLHGIGGPDPWRDLVRVLSYLSGFDNRRRGLCRDAIFACRLEVGTKSETPDFQQNFQHIAASPANRRCQSGGVTPFGCRLLGLSISRVRHLTPRWSVRIAPLPTETRLA